MKIPATIITGFLGAGKTTLIRHLLENANGKRIALVINEFGELGIDREMIAGCGIKGCDDNAVLELANGCICCTVADDFLPTMETLLHRVEPPDHIVIETSGLALPKPLVRAFNWPEIRSQVTVDGVIAVVDSLAVSEGRFASDPDAVQRAREADEALDHDAPLEEVFEDQLLCADMVLLNKCDLLDSERLESVLRDLDNNTAAAVRIVATSHGAIDPLVLLGIGAAYLLAYPVVVWLARRMGAWDPLHDLVSFTLAGLLAAGAIARKLLDNSKNFCVHVLLGKSDF